MLSDDISYFAERVSEIIKYECSKSRYESYMKWKTDEIKVTVATSAFGMGIDEQDIRHTVR